MKVNQILNSATRGYISHTSQIKCKWFLALAYSCVRALRYSQAQNREPEPEGSIREWPFLFAELVESEWKKKVFDHLNDIPFQFVCGFMQGLFVQPTLSTYKNTWYTAVLLTTNVLVLHK